MLHNPCLCGPDSFVLAVPIDLQGLSLQFFESDWGTTDEQLCFYEGKLLGIAYPVKASAEIASLAHHTLKNFEPFIASAYVP